MPLYTLRPTSCLLLDSSIITSSFLIVISLCYSWDLVLDAVVITVDHQASLALEVMSDLGEYEVVGGGIWFILRSSDHLRLFLHS